MKIIRHSLRDSFVNGKSDPLPRKRVLNPKKIDPNGLYNRLQTQGGLILIDSRDRSHYCSHAGFIKTAINIPLTKNRIVEPADSDEMPKFMRRKLCEIVIYNNRPCIWSKERHWLHSIVRHFVNEGIVASISILSVSFDDFGSLYPFMVDYYDASFRPMSSGFVKPCSDDSYRLNYPNEIVCGFLYLGNMWQATEHRIIKDLKVTHIINASLDCTNVFENEGVVYYNVKLPDRENENISQFFQSSCSFIVESVKANPNAKVLIHCTQGISRSAALTIWYLMAHFNWTLSESYNYVLSKRGLIYPNIGFMKQLVTEEERLYSCNSIQCDAINLLLDGQYPSIGLDKIQQKHWCFSWKHIRRKFLVLYNN